MLKLFNPLGPATWLICELDADGDTLYGLCDLGFGEPELGYVSLDCCLRCERWTNSAWSSSSFSRT
ncbi:hypothetical protein C0214_00505 [Methylobacterium sp. DM1]|nr:hypothetical protein C0214_00505 [Methylobacterium sp. DM1]